MSCISIIIMDIQPNTTVGLDTQLAKIPETNMRSKYSQNIRQFFSDFRDCTYRCTQCRCYKDNDYPMLYDL